MRCAATRIIVKLQDHLQQPAVVLQELLYSFASSMHIRPLFFSTAATELQKLLRRVIQPGYQPPDFHSYFTITLQDASLEKQVVDHLKCQRAVTDLFEDMVPSPPPAVFTSDGIRYCPGYLQPAPRGINALSAWLCPGGKGTGIRFADIEQGWSHRGLPVTLHPDSGIGLKDFEQHGGAVLSVLLLPENERGGLGIVPEAGGCLFSQWRPDGSFNTADALLASLRYLQSGDVILLQAQMADRAGRFWPVEIQPPVFEAIRLATALGITVIEAAANGGRMDIGNNLDCFKWQGTKVLNRKHSDFKDSGAVVVAAATCTVPHRRMPFSNYGNRIDCYAWGEKVNPHHDFRIGLSGTSSAAAIISGAAIALQGITKKRTGAPLSPARVRTLLASPILGTAPAGSDNIGVMPDLERILSTNFHKWHEGNLQPANFK